MYNNVKKIRKEKGISQKEICEALNISQSALSNKEASRRPFTVKELLILEKILGVSIGEMFKD